MFVFSLRFKTQITRWIVALSLGIALLCTGCGGKGISPGPQGPDATLPINPPQSILTQTAPTTTTATQDRPPMQALTQPIGSTVETAMTTPSFSHVTIVVMENHNYGQIIGSTQAPYINSLARINALFTNSHAISHPSEPNYLALYSGSTHGVSSDACPLRFAGSSLGGELIRASRRIRGYMEELPAVGWMGCSYANYWRKHDPLTDFSDTPSSDVVPYSQLSSDITSNTYPSVALVVPNLMHDMHDGTVAMGDAWLAANLPKIISYDASHNGLLVITWDESANDASNWIATIFVGPMVRPGRYGQSINHYSVLRTVTDEFRLTRLNPTAGISGVWR
jgi:phosphatidylinositol-3-phosphatase